MTGCKPAMQNQTPEKNRKPTDHPEEEQHAKAIHQRS
jgi:hypothetical protein